MTTQRRSLLLASGLLAAPSLARAQDFPARPIRVVVPYAPLIQTDRARGIALTSGKRRGSLAHLPTLAESGFPVFDLTSWNGLFAPAATSAPIRARLGAALHHATTDEATRKRLAASGNDVVTESAEAFGERIRKDWELVRPLIRETGLKIE
ncbi:MAG: hypothetical protein FJX33_14575 [Alphaproteobacteria bacterium]|nr:hypothetical protein [Alphaproteobacteria bacterium]